MRILILNGVNLGCLGTREVSVYGKISFKEYYTELQKKHPDVELAHFQSDDVAEIVNHILNASDFDGIILNPGAYTHTSIVLADAVKSIKTPVVEVHISNLFSREQYRRKSCLSGCCSGFISGFGLKGYELALQSFTNN